MRYRTFGLVQSPAVAPAVLPRAVRPSEQAVYTPTQYHALGRLAEMVRSSVNDKLVHQTALQCIASVPPRNTLGYTEAEIDRMEIEAIFAAIKHGNPDVPLLRKGFRYVADPRTRDLFKSARVKLEMLASGANGGDCDDHAEFLGALLGTIGFAVGARAYGAINNNEYDHVYGIVRWPKRPGSGDRPIVLGLDTTFKESYVGWEPSPGRYADAWAT